MEDPPSKSLDLDSASTGTQEVVREERKLVKICFPQVSQRWVSRVSVPRPSDHAAEVVLGVLEMHPREVKIC